MSKRSPDYYQILGIDYDATPRQIWAAYRRLRDRYSDDRAKMRQINHAYTTLSDSGLKEEYDKKNRVSVLALRAKRDPRKPSSTPIKTEVYERGPDRGRQANGSGQNQPLARTEILDVPPGGGSSVTIRSDSYTPLNRTEILTDPPYQDEDQTKVMESGTPASEGPDQAHTQIHERHIPPASLEIEIPGESPWIYKLGAARTTIGRRSSNDIVLTDPQMFISRHHAYIVAKPDGYYVVDDGSSNGTRVQGSEIPPRREIRLLDGHVIEIEGRKLTFRLNPQSH